MKRSLLFLSGIVWIFATDVVHAQDSQKAPEIVVGSKAFTESVILGELAGQMAQSAGAKVTHLKRLGGTVVLWQALQLGSRREGIDLYVEYTGTITQDLLKNASLRTEKELRQELEKLGIGMSRPLGFNNTYALGMKEERAAQLGVRTISDLRAHPDLKLGFSVEFLQRGDGWPKVRDAYSLPQKNVSGLEHALAYRGIESGALDITDLYSTDPEIHSFGLRVLKDDLQIFPSYFAVILYRLDLKDRAPEVVKAVLELEGRIPPSSISEMNALAQPREGSPISENRLASDFLKENPYFHSADQIESSPPVEENAVQLIIRQTRRHLLLVAISLVLAIGTAIPLGIAAARWSRTSQFILSGIGIVQTIPSLALLAILVPWLHLGVKPAIVALFLYSLLPIVRNTYTGLKDIPLSIRESAIALGLGPLASLRLVEMPLASRSILAGIKTAAVINVGTATLGGLVGAGGYGEIIFTGITLNNSRIILEGAIPAALLALLVQFMFDWAESLFVPKGLRLKTEE